jgi:hypothetical protein
MLLTNTNVFNVVTWLNYMQFFLKSPLIPLFQRGSLLYSPQLLSPPLPFSLSLKGRGAGVRVIAIKGSREFYRT